jgi:hypothetical protein
MRGSAQTPSPKEKLLTNVFWKSYCAAVMPCSRCNGERVIVSTLCAEFSRKDLNSDSLLPLFGQGAGVPYGCGMGRLSGETMAKLLDELGRGSKPRSRRALVRVHWRSLIVIAGKRCEISKALRQRSSAIRFPACQRSIGENANGLTEEAVKGVRSAATCIVATTGLASRNRSS